MFTLVVFDSKAKKPPAIIKNPWVFQNKRDSYVLTYESLSIIGASYLFLSCLKAVTPSYQNTFH